MGGRKLHQRLERPLEAMDIRMGRDAFFDLLREEGLLVGRRRRGPVTTLSRHRFRCFDNLLEGLAVERPEQVWVSDITYIRLAQGFAYLSLITDAYSRRVMGYHLHPTLEASGPLKALSMAVKARLYHQSLIHHSDRGMQYCSHEYTKKLEGAGIAISMTLSGSAENAIAERVNGILKSEYLLDSTFETYEAAIRHTAEAIALYNSDRQHLSLSMLTPDEVHRDARPVTRMWKDYRKRAA